MSMWLKFSAMPSESMMSSDTSSPFLFFTYRAVFSSAFGIITSQKTY